MIIAIVVDNIVASQKHSSHVGQIILLVQPIDLEGRASGDPIVAVASIGAGPAGIGDRVLLVQEGFSAMTSVGLTQAPIDAAVIGVIDRVELS